ncbi:MAG: hypothetical protein N2606_04925 [Candidatus Omnitrophica bacterium]|nr:hypothetical protein [Candidatus Omnitrophota bacterium]
MKMKKSIILLVGTMIILISQSAYARFFDDESGTKWWMNPNQWQYLSSSEEVQTVENFDDDRLDVLSKPSTKRGFAVFGSKWMLDLNNDFDLSIQYHYGHKGMQSDDEGYVVMGLYRFTDDADNPLSAQIAAGNIMFSFFPTTPINFDIISADSSLPQTRSALWRRFSSDGILSMHYDSISNNLVMYSIEGDEQFPMGIFTVENLRDVSNYFGVFLGGSANKGASLEMGDAYLKNFNMRGTITPEPVSSALFLVGAGAFGVVCLRKKKTN